MEGSRWKVYIGERAGGVADHGIQYPYITAYRGIAGLCVGSSGDFLGLSFGQSCSQCRCFRPRKVAEEITVQNWAVPRAR